MGVGAMLYPKYRRDRLTHTDDVCTWAQRETQHHVHLSWKYVRENREKMKTRRSPRVVGTPESGAVNCARCISYVRKAGESQSPS